MKPTLDSITNAYHLSRQLQQAAETAKLQLCQASTAHLCTSPKMAREKLTVARRNLVTMRRTQTAAIKNIDTAIKSL